MATNKTEMVSSGLDTIKIIGALLLVGIGIAGFYYFEGESVLYRVLGFLALFGAAFALFLTTSKGRALGSFLKESRVEVRKMVWPTRAEALQTTLIVGVLVFVVGLFLWLLDMFLGWAVHFIISGGA
ncbi:MAG: preprotein translocase subunit SecE [bacterium]